MNLGHIYDILVVPMVTEKTNQLLSDNKYCFKVKAVATKKDIKKAIETIFEVSVEKINIINIKGKAKRFKGAQGRRSDFKKAFICIKKGQEINFSKLG